MLSKSLRSSSNAFICSVYPFTVTIGSKSNYPPDFQFSSSTIEATLKKWMCSGFDSTQARRSRRFPMNKGIQCLDSGAGQGAFIVCVHLSAKCSSEEENIRCYSANPAATTPYIYIFYSHSGDQRYRNGNNCVLAADDKPHQHGAHEEHILVICINNNRQCLVWCSATASERVCRYYAWVCVCKNSFVCAITKLTCVHRACVCPVECVLNTLTDILFFI